VRTETYKVVFDAGDKLYRCRVHEVVELARFEQGSQWTLTVNAFGSLTSVKPAK
jgi:hypothetical protein